MLQVLLMLAMVILPPCASEEATNCVWNAAEQGNGSGSSFIDVDGTTLYVTPRGVAS